MVLISLAHAFEGEASMGRVGLASHGDVVSEGRVWRAEAGAALGRLHVHGAVSVTLFNATDAYTQLETTGTVLVPGDFSLFQVGPTVSYLVPVGRFRFGGEAEVALAYLSSPIAPSFTQELQAEVGTPVTSTGLGAWVGGGGVAGFAIVPDHAWFEVHSGLGYETVNGLGLAVSVRVGFSAAL